MSVHANGSASKKDLKEVNQYLENVDPEKVEKVYDEVDAYEWKTSKIPPSLVQHPLKQSRHTAMSAHVDGSASKEDLKEVNQHLENVDPEKVEKVYDEVDAYERKTSKIPPSLVQHPLKQSRHTAMSVHVNGSASKKDLKEVKQYLENVDPEKVEKVYGEGKYIPWHGDRKSQSQTNITFQTKSMHTSGEPPKYVIIVARKGKPGAYVTYESSTWSDSVKTIIDEMIKAIEAKNEDVKGTMRYDVC